MRLTIVPVDSPDNKGSVGKNEVFHTFLDLSSCNIPENIHALQWFGSSGWIEFKDPIPNQEISELPSWVASCLTKWDEANAPEPILPATAEINKKRAVRALKETDWAATADVGDPTKSNPYLSNVQDFVVYRNEIRQHAINPVDGDLTWPTVPKAIWATV